MNYPLLLWSILQYGVGNKGMTKLMLGEAFELGQAIDEAWTKLPENYQWLKIGNLFKIEALHTPTGPVNRFAIVVFEQQERFTFRIVFNP